MARNSHPRPHIVKNKRVTNLCTNCELSLPTQNSSAKVGADRWFLLWKPAGRPSAEPESFNRPLAKAKANTADQPQQRHWQQSMLCHLLAAVLPTLWGMGRLANLPSQHCAPRTAQRLPLRYSSGASVVFFPKNLETQQVGPSCAKKKIIQNWMPRRFLFRHLPFAIFCRMDFRSLCANKD